MLQGAIFRDEMKYKYSLVQARAYSQLGIAGTTYEPGFKELSRLGYFQGKTVLDFGTGTGRTARLLKLLGAKRVLAVDRDEQMLARVPSDEGIEPHLLTESHIPFPDASVDVAVSAHAFVELRTREEMQQAANEIARMLVPAGMFLLITTNPAAIGCDYKSYKYENIDELKSGDSITCLIKTEPSFTIIDTYWTLDVYQQVLQSAGFTRIQMTFPLADDGEGWLDEQKIAPDVVFVGIKTS